MTAFLKANALLKYYFHLTEYELLNMEGDQWASTYAQLRYALEFDAARANSDGKQKIYLPL